VEERHACGRLLLGRSLNSPGKNAKTKASVELANQTVLKRRHEFLLAVSGNRGAARLWIETGNRRECDRRSSDKRVEQTSSSERSCSAWKSCRNSSFAFSRSTPARFGKTLDRDDAFLRKKNPTRESNRTCDSQLLLAKFHGVTDSVVEIRCEFTRISESFG